MHNAPKTKKKANKKQHYLQMFHFLKRGILIAKQI